MKQWLEEIFLFDFDSIQNKPSCLYLCANLSGECLEEAPLAERETTNILRLLPHFLRLGPNDEVGFIHFTVQEYLFSQPQTTLRGPAFK